MPRAQRSRIPRAVESEVLFRADHTCCVCRTRWKDVQLQHIDGNPSNNRLSNLAVVCLDCHSQITGRRGLGKSFTPSEVRKYQRAWESQVAGSRRVHRPRISYRRELISQIDVIICEILACHRDRRRVGELLEVLYELHVWRGNREIDGKITEGLYHLAVMSGGWPGPVSELLPEKLWELCWHFVGPDDVPMDKHGSDHVLDCIDVLNALAEFTCLYGHGRKTLLSITEHAENLFEIGLWYARRRIANAVAGGYREALESCYSEGKLAWPHGRTTIRRSVRKLQKLLQEHQPDWRYQRQRLRALLTI